MSYRVDIPTLSANEVYTLTFEYEGTETIQLIVGDLTLETTDRRVVFTTTSPVNYIESNVNLTNLNIYEGYYESDDFGGEYTQESIIEGMSLVNLIQSEKHLDFQNNSCGVETFEDNMIKLTITDVSSLTSTWQRGWMKTSANLKVGATYTCVVHVVENSISTEGIRVGASYGTLVHGSDSNSLGGGETGVIVFTYTTATATLKDYNGYYDGFCCVNGVGDWQNGSLKYGIMVFEGDYYDYFVNNNIPYFEGIGCVKSPKIVSYPKYTNIAPNCKRDLSDVTPTAYRSDDNSYIKITNTARWVGVSFGYYPQDFGYGMGDIFCLEFDVLDYKGTGTISNGNTGMMTLVSGEYLNSTGGVCYIDKIGHYKEYFICNGNSENGRVCLITVHLNTGTGGINTLIEIDNLKVYKIDNINDTNEYEEGVVSTPDDLELYCNYHYDKNTKTSNPCYQDTLDLTTGTVTRKNIKARLNESIAKYGTVEGALVTVNGGDMVRVKYNHMNTSTGTFPVQVDGEVIGSSVTGIVLGASQGGYDGAWYPTSDIEHAYTNPNTIFMFFNPSRFDGIDYTDSTTIKNWLIEQDFTLIIKIQNASVYTEQLPTSINPLKSYYNGSIQTSSQQLAPTLKTTLPVSNKFTTTNLTSGLTYNVYFDGTATKLDAGGTIITNPVSPCEVECGGTTLTIEGTDIQNVKVLETTNKNEVGSVCGTTDVELSRITTKCGIHNMFDDYFQGSHNTQWAKDYQCTSTRDDTTVKIVGKGPLNYAGYSLVESLPFGTYKLHYKVKVSTIGDKYKVALSSNPNGIPQDAYVPVTDVTSTALVEEQTFVFYKKHITNMLFYTYTNGQEIEYYDISLIKLSDEDITGTDTSNINYSQTISDLEQPIKLRSLGTTYDSYNPVTGELAKRIGVSETDGSYSVLSEPIVENISMGIPVTNLVNATYPINTNFYDFAVGNSFINQPCTLLIDVESNGITYDFGIINSQGTSFSFLTSTLSDSGILKFEFTPTNTNGTLRFRRKSGSVNATINGVALVIGQYESLTKPFEGTKYIQMPPHLYTNGQVKVYSDSDVYPTTILNGQSTNNYEINELNTSNNYTIRYDGECESINLANKSNTQGNNVLVKAGAASGNLTFVNDSGDINNVLLVQNDVREQEINHFTGLQTVEVSGMLIENQGNMWWNDWIAPSQYGASYQVDSPEFISVQPGETIYVVADNNNYTSLFEFDENYNMVNQSNNLILGNGSVPTPIRLDNGYYKNYKILSENTRYIKFTIPASTAGNAKNITQWSIVSFTRADIGNVPLFTNNTPYRGSIINFPQPVQLNSLPDGTCDTYNPITGEYVQNVGYFVLDDTFASRWLIVKTKDGKPVAQRDLSTQEPNYSTLVRDYSFPAELYDYQAGTRAIANIPLAYYIDHTSSNIATPSLYGATYFGNHYIRIALPFTPNDLDQWNYSYTQVNNWLREKPIHIVYKRTEPITTQLTPIEIPTFEGGILQLITTDGKVFPMIEYSMPTNNRYDISSWETGVVYTQRNMTEAYFNESTTPMTPTETMTLTTDHISSGSIILNDNGNGLIVLKGNYTGRDIPYFTGMRSVEAIEVETTPSPDQPLFGKGGRK